MQAEIIFGILGAATRLRDHEAAAEMFRIYNDWLVDFCRHYPERHIGLACLPYGDIGAAVREIHRVAKMGLRGLELSCSWDMEPMWHPSWEPLWQAVNEVGLPLHFHTFPTMPPSVREKATGLTRRAAMFTSVSGFQMNLINILAAVIGSAVLERYPNIRISFGESGIGWLPYALDRMDFEWEDRFRDLGLRMKPSDYWRRQCKATFQFDRIGTQLIDEIGEDTLMWGSDYPARRRRVAGVFEVHRGAVRPPAGRDRAQDRLRERGEVLRPDQVALGSGSSLQARECAGHRFEVTVRADVPGTALWPAPGPGWRDRGFPGPRVAEPSWLPHGGRAPRHTGARRHA